MKIPKYFTEFYDKTSDFENGYAQIFDFEENGLAFCKGIFVKNMNSFFSYNFKDGKLNPDRNEFVKISPESNASFWLRNVDELPVIKKILEKIIAYYESEANNENSNKEPPCECEISKHLVNVFDENICDVGDYHAFLWKKALEEIYEKEIEEKGLEGIALKTDYKVPEYLSETLKKYKILNLPKDWVDAFSRAGIKKDSEIIPEYVEEDIATSLTLDYGKGIWNEEKIVLDACQNHLPADSGGNNIFLKFQTIDDKWHDYTEFNKYEDNQIKKIKISDDGRGYDYKSLGLLVSAKEHQNSTGKWGEGLKMIAAAALRNNENIEFSSRNWSAVPYSEKEIINEGKENEKVVERLKFKVKIGTREFDNDSEKEIINERKEMSSTTFSNPSSELISIFRNIKEEVLAFSNVDSIFSAKNIDILDMLDGKLYIKDIIIPGECDTKYTYNLKDFDIETRDRNSIKQSSLKGEISKFLENIEDERFIKFFFRDANEFATRPGDTNYVEFFTNFYIPSNSDKADMWINSFKNYFGENACIRNMSSQDGLQIGQAQHLGLEVITLPDCLANILTNVRGKDGNRILTYEEVKQQAIDNAIPVDEKDLSLEETAIINQLYKYNDIISLSPETRFKIKKINVYEYEEDYTGKKAAGFAGLGDTINICRESLERGLEYSADVFFHEVGHAQTGAKDSEPEFRDYHTRLLANVVTKVFPLEQSIIDNGLVKNTRLSKFKNFMRKVFWSKIVNEERKEQNDNISGNNVVDEEEYGL